MTGINFNNLTPSNAVKESDYLMGLLSNEQYSFSLDYLDTYALVRVFDRQTNYVVGGVTLPYAKLWKEVTDNLGYNFITNGGEAFTHYVMTASTQGLASRFKKVEYTKYSPSAETVSISRWDFRENQVVPLKPYMTNKEIIKFLIEYLKVLFKKKNKGVFMWGVDEYGYPVKITEKSPTKKKVTVKSAKSLKTKKGNTMDKVKVIATETIDKNKEALALAARLEVGKVATAQMKKVVKPKLPMMVRGYADHALFDVVLANAVGVALREFAGQNEKAQIVGDAMIQSAAVELISSFDINDLINEMLANIDISKITKLDSKD